jgi:hypothetical protein
VSTVDAIPAFTRRQVDFRLVVELGQRRPYLFGAFIEILAFSILAYDQALVTANFGTV